MAKKPIKIDSASSDFTIEKSNRTYVLGVDEIISSSTIKTETDAPIKNIVLKIDGTITSSVHGIQIGADGSVGNKIVVSESGLLDTKFAGIFAVGDKTHITNSGTILVLDPDYSVGMESTGNDARIVNDGFMKADLGFKVTGDDNLVINSGLLNGYGGSIGVKFDTDTGDNNRFVNTGKLDSSRSVEGDVGNETVINKGQISGTMLLGDGDDVLITHQYVGGDVSMGDGDDRVVLKGDGGFTSLNMGAGDDVLDLRVGERLGVETTITGGVDDDVYLVSRTDLYLVEFMGGGTDTIKSTVTYTLAQNFENLTLIGKKSINGNGSDAANHLTGNSADNRLDGKAGMDRLEGGAGKDMLTGGTDADVFVFERGSGKDTITDFANGSDTIDLSGYKGVNSFDDLDGKITQAGDDVLIMLRDGDRIRIENFDAGNLSDTHFDF